MVGFYVYFPPVRAGPIRQLKLNESLSLIKGKWYLDLRKVTITCFCLKLIFFSLFQQQKYKIYSKYGPLITELHEKLVEPVSEYIDGGYRKMLLCNDKEEDHLFFFVNNRGQPFQSGTWSSRMQNTFFEQTGKRIGNNLLRDSFITYIYGKDISNRLKESIAEHMGHRIETAETHYNRMPSLQKRRLGLEFASELVETTLNKKRKDEKSPPQDPDQTMNNDDKKRRKQPTQRQPRDSKKQNQKTENVRTSYRRTEFLLKHWKKPPDCYVWISLKDQYPTRLVVSPANFIRLFNGLFSGKNNTGNLTFHFPLLFCAQMENKHGKMKQIVRINKKKTEQRNTKFLHKNVFYLELKVE